MSEQQRSRTLRHLQPKREKWRSLCGSSIEDLLLGEPLHSCPCEQALWRAVIVQMVTDALSLSGKDEARHHRREALAWLSGTSRDFRMVCELAGYDPQYIREKAAALLALHRPSPPPRPRRPDMAPSSFPHFAFTQSPARLAAMRVQW